MEDEVGGGCLETRTDTPSTRSRLRQEGLSGPDAGPTILVSQGAEEAAGEVCHDRSELQADFPAESLLR